MPNSVDEKDQHCPFLNRADERCGPHFHVDSLGHAFAYCFDRYRMCPHYLELLVERRVRRLTASACAMAAAHNLPGAGTDGTDADDDDTHDSDQPAAPGRAPRPPRVYVQLRIGGGPGSCAAVAA